MVARTRLVGGGGGRQMEAEWRKGARWGTGVCQHYLSGPSYRLALVHQDTLIQTSTRDPQTSEHRMAGVCVLFHVCQFVCVYLVVAADVMRDT